MRLLQAVVEVHPREWVLTEIAGCARLPGA